MRLLLSFCLNLVTDIILIIRPTSSSNALRFSSDKPILTNKEIIVYNAAVATAFDA